MANIRKHVLKKKKGQLSSWERNNVIKIKRTAGMSFEDGTVDHLDNGLLDRMTEKKNCLVDTAVTHESAGCNLTRH